MGACIEFDPALAVQKYGESLTTLVKDMAFELGDDQPRTVAILIGLNASDFTYGWNGYINGVTLFYSHYTKVFLRKKLFNKFFKSYKPQKKHILYKYF